MIIIKRIAPPPPPPPPQPPPPPYIGVLVYIEPGSRCLFIGDTSVIYSAGETITYYDYVFYGVSITTVLEINILTKIS